MVHYAHDPFLKKYTPVETVEEWVAKGNTITQVSPKRKGKRAKPLDPEKVAELLNTLPKEIRDKLTK